MKKSLLALASVLAIVAGCAKEKLGTSIKSHSGIKEITATIAEPTKTYLSEDGGVYKLFWYEEEEIAVGAGNSFADFILTEGADTPKGKFETGEDLPEEDFWFACSPKDALVSSKGDSLFVTYPEELTYNEFSGVVEGCEIMAAKSATPNFAFHNAVGYIKFELAVKETEEITSIEVSGKDGKYIAGNAKIVFDGSEIDTVRFLSGSAYSVKVNFLEPRTVTPSENFITYIPVAPMANGVTINVVMKSGKAMALSTTSETSINVGQLLELPAIEFAPVTVAKVGDEEYYSIDQAILAACEAGKDETVTLLRDCTVGSDCEVLSQNVITVDLAGKTIYSAGSKFFTVASGTKECIIIDSSEEKTGTITNSNPSNAAMRVYGRTIVKGGTIISQNSYGINMIGGSLILEGGLIQGGSAGVYCKKDADNTIDSVVVNGASIVSTGSNGMVLNALNASLIFRSGTLQSLKAGIYVYDGWLKVYDGFLGAKSNVIYGARGSSYNNQIDIFGGFFHRDSTTNSIVYGHLITDTTRVVGGYFNVSPSPSYIPSGYEVGSCDTTVNGIKFTSTIIKAADVACDLTIDGKTTQKASVNEAFAAAMAQDKPAVIKLLADCSTLDSIHLEGPHEFTFDLNGHTLTTPGTKVFRVWNQTVLTIKSSQEGGMIFESSTGSNSMLVKPGGKIILESGCLKGANSSAGHLYIKGEPGNLAEFVMNGGEIWTPAYNPVSLVSDCKFIMNGGTLITEKAETACINANGNSIAEFYGGTFVSATPEYGVKAEGTATFNGDFKNLAIQGAGAITIAGGNYTGIIRTTASNLIINGGTFTNDSTTQALYAKAGSNIQINGGTFSAHSPYGTIRTHGTMVIEEGVTVISDYETNSNTLYVGDGASYPGNLVINGGKFIGYKNAYVSGGVLSINGGTFKSNQRAAYAASAGAVSISSGYFESPADSALLVGNVDGAITGGWYTQPVADTLINGAYVLDSTSPVIVEGVTYNYQVIANPDAKDLIKVNGTAYKTVASALAAIDATDGDITITILEDCSSLNAVELSGNRTVSLDLNGKICGIPFVSTAKTFNITDNSTDANGRLLPADGLCALEVNAGTTNFSKGFIESVKKTAVMVKGDASNKATFNFNGGEIISNTETTATANEDGGAVCVIDNSEFNMNAGIIRNPSKRALWTRSFTAGTYPYCNIHDGVLIAGGNVYYVYTRAKVTIDGGLFIGTNSNTVCHNGTSNAEVENNIKGGYFVCGKSYDWSGYNATSVGTYHFTGGHYTRSPKMYNSNTAASSNVAPEAGYVIATMAAPETKEFEGVTYTFTHEIKVQ